MQPVRKVLTATHFKYLEDVKKWTPCSPGDPDAQEKSWTDIESDELQEPGLRVADFLKSVDNVRPTVTAEDLKKHDQWTLESGEPGNAAVITTLVPQAQTNAAYRERGIMKMKNAVSPYIVPLRTYRSFDWFWNGLFPIVQLVVEAGLFQSVREGAMGPVCLLRANFFLCDPVRAPMVMLILQWVGRERQGTAQTTRSALPARSARTASLDAPYGRLGRCFPGRGQSRFPVRRQRSGFCACALTLSLSRRLSRFAGERETWRLGSRRCTRQCSLLINAPGACVMEDFSRLVPDGSPLPFYQRGSLSNC